uniref:Beta-adaptin appendage C-terminal subdomain domain-containing protein n=1 Tax=Fundulus heteroclitus TaxID=8078 RepID=A0A3Q2PPZ6_FUNHE
HRWEPVAVKNNIDVFYFSCQYPISMLFVEDGKMERQVFLATWKDIPNDSEAQFQIADCRLNAASNKLQGSNIFTIAKRTVDGQDMLYQSTKLSNGIWVLAELRVQTGNPNFTVSPALLSVAFPVPVEDEASPQDDAAADTWGWEGQGDDHKTFVHAFLVSSFLPVLYSGRMNSCPVST